MVSNTWESGLQVGLLIPPLGFPGKYHLLHQPSSSTLLSHARGGFNICLLPALSAFFPLGGGKESSLKSKELTAVPFYSAPYTSFFFFSFFFFLNQGKK